MLQGCLGPLKPWGAELAGRFMGLSHISAILHYSIASSLLLPARPVPCLPRTHHLAGDMASPTPVEW